MNIAYLCYWGINEGLTVSTALPSLRALAAYDFIERIDFYTIERADIRVTTNQTALPAKVHHHPIIASRARFGLFKHGLTQSRTLLEIRSGLRKHHSQLMVCRGAMSGFQGHILHRLTGIPYIVESFEPHSDYMVDAGEWPRGGLKHRFQTLMEGLTKKTAAGFLPVAMNYERALLEQGIPAEKIRVVPCTVPLETFRFSPEARAEVRTRLRVPPDAVVGVYAGKFGGIYYETEAFEVFRKGFDLWPDRFFLIILTSNPQEYVQDYLTRAGIDSRKVFTTLAPHAEVPKYLSAADLAYNLVKPGPSKRFTSSIKNGEYWASGLPMLIPPDMGDDSDIITREGIGGAIFDLSRQGSLEAAYRSVAHYLATHPREDPSIVRLAREYRSPEFIRRGYDHFLLPYAGR